MDAMTGLPLVGVSIVATFVVLAAFLWVRGPAYRSGSFLGIATASAVFAVFSSLLYVVYFSFPHMAWTLAAGDAAMVLAPALLWVAVGALNDRRPWRLWVVIAGGAAMFVCSTLLSETVSSGIKILLLIVGCTLTAVEARIGRARATSGTLAIAATMAGYAIYSVGRAIFLAINGLYDGIYAQFFSTGPTTIAGVIAVILLAFGVLAAARDERASRRVQQVSTRDRLAARARTILAENGAVSWRVATVDELELIRESFGQEYIDEVNTALVAACTATLAGDAEVGLIGAGRVAMVCPVTIPEVAADELRQRFAQSSARLRETYVPDLEVAATKIESDVVLDSVVAHS
ncbi:hypothetical protein [Microbacterium sp. Clip185]|uniref:hypothetical protein n=1 Tax=Microbacterium sp. Clip185 TaxID=3025663 RepID=UPI002366C7E6|nr:hypothetical protein [Microbacterium sp. Clip185]WDG18693.1 hypothetical protein PQV94_02865 [Microbacterium sp. Clip185]